MRAEACTWTRSCASVESAAHVLSAARLPPPKEYAFEYFLSHKKSHSKDGLVPGQIAKNLHDSLSLLGHQGWFDVDNLETITKESLRDSVSKCASMIVMINDETAESEWCLFEWACASEAGIPIKVIVDMERCSKKAALALLGAAHSHMLQYQLIEYTEAHRRECLAGVTRFLQECASRRNTLRLSSTSQPRELRLIPPHFEMLCLFCGMPISTTEGRLADAWVVCARVLIALLHVYWIIQLVYAKGPMFNNYMTCASSNFFVVAASVQMILFTQILRSEKLAKMLANVHEFETGEELATRLYTRTQVGAHRILQALLFYEMFMLPVFVSVGFDSFYFGDEQPLWNHILGLSNIFFTIFVFQIFLVSTCVNSYLCSFILRLSRIQLEAAFDELSTTIAQVGIRRFVTLPSVAEPLTVTPEALMRFKRVWNEGVRQHRHVEKVLVPVCWILFIHFLFDVCKPAVMLNFGMPVRATSWLNIAYVPLYWFAPVQLFRYLLMAIERHRHGVRIIVNFGKEILCTSPANEALLIYLQKDDMEFYFLQAPPFAVNSAMTLVVALLSVAAAVPFFYLEWTIAPWPLS